MKRKNPFVEENAPKEKLQLPAYMTVEQSKGLKQGLCVFGGLAVLLIGAAFTSNAVSSRKNAYLQSQMELARAALETNGYATARQILGKISDSKSNDGYGSDIAALLGHHTQEKSRTR